MLDLHIIHDHGSHWGSIRRGETLFQVYSGARCGPAPACSITGKSGNSQRYVCCGATAGDICIGFGGMRIDRTVAQDAKITLKQRKTLWVCQKRNEVPVGGGSLPLLLVGVKARTMAHSLVSTPTRK